MREEPELCSIDVSDIKTSVLIWGIGNVLLGDDAAGPYIASRVGGTDCGTTPENYIAKLRKLDKTRRHTLIIVDAADMGDNAGTTRRLSADEMRGAAITSHGVPLTLLLEPFADNIDIIFIGIQPKQMELGAPMSNEVEAAAEKLVEKLKTLSTE